MKVLKRLESSKNTWIVLFVLILFFLLRLPSFFEPYWYGDEGVYQAVGMAVRDNKLLYKDIWDNKPPLIYVVYSVFNSNQFGVRVVSLLFGISSVFIFFLLAKTLFKDTKNFKIYFFSTLVFALLFGLPIIEGNIANAENFMLLPILAAGFLIFITSSIPTYKPSHHKKSSNSYLIPNTYYRILFLSGFLLGIAFLFKVVATFDFVAFLAFIAIVALPQKPKITNIKQFLKQIALFPVGLLSPILLTALFFIFKGGFNDFLQAVFLQNIGYVGYENTFIIPQGLILLKLILLLAFVFYIFKIRKILSLTAIFILVWFAFSLFNAFFAQRPYSHYLLVLAPSFSLMLGLILWDQKHKKAIASFLIVSALFILNNFYFFSKPITYYQNFTDFIANKKSVSEYQGFFDKRTPIDYEVASFLKSRLNDNDSMFVWGNNPQLYKLVNVVPPTKYVAAYQITNYQESVANTIETLERVQPRFIVITSNPESMPLSLFDYSAGVRINGAIIYERIF